MGRITWASFNIEGTNMKEVNLGFIYQLGAQIYLLTKQEEKHRLGIGSAIIGMEDNIKQLFKEYPELAVCRSSGKKLLSQVKRVNKWITETLSQKGTRINKADEWVDAMFGVLIDHAQEFQIVLLADLEKLSVYQPLQKNGYDTRTLVSQTEQVFPKGVLSKLSNDIILEIKEFGKCLVFDNYTASGFHILRALEIVLHNYYVLMCKPSNPKKKLDSWAEYLRLLENICNQTTSLLSDEDKRHIRKVCSLLNLIKKDHRNLIMHPEITLKEDDALSLFDIVKGAIEAMVEKL
jgi:hypothetical protein